MYLNRKIHCYTLLHTLGDTGGEAESDAVTAAEQFKNDTTDQINSAISDWLNLCASFPRI